MLLDIIKPDSKLNHAKKIEHLTKVVWMWLDSKILRYQISEIKL